MTGEGWILGDLRFDKPAFEVLRCRVGRVGVPYDGSVTLDGAVQCALQEKTDATLVPAPQPRSPA